MLLVACILSPANIDSQDDGHDFGDYGVARRMTFARRNPFVIDAQLKEVGHR